MGDETLDLQTNSRPNDFGRNTVAESSACQNQVNESDIDDRIGKVVGSAVMTVGNRMLDMILAAMDIVVIPQVEMAMKSITESSRGGPSTTVQDQNDSTGKTETFRSSRPLTQKIYKLINVAAHLRGMRPAPTTKRDTLNLTKNLNTNTNNQFFN